MSKKISKSFISILLALILVIAPQTYAFAADPSASNTPVATTQPTELTLKEAVDKKASIITKLYNVSSIQYALISDGEIILSGQSGYNDKASKTAPTDSTKYGIGSVSKIFTTVGVLKLVEEGQLDLDTPITKYIPDFKMADERYKKITARMLLNHSSGLLGSALDNCMLFGDVDTTTHDNFLKILSTQRLKAAPGAFSVYSNDGFTLAEILIERVSGVSYTEFIRTNFTDQLNMTNTKTPSDSFKKSSLANIYSTDGTKLPYETLCAYGAGGIISTAIDLCKFSKLFTTANNILSNDSTKAMQNNEYANGQWFKEEDSILSYGLGWDSVNTYPFTRYGIKALVKGGDTINYHTSLIVLPEENMSVAVLSSGGSSGINQLLGQYALLEALKEKGSIKEILPDKTFSAPVKQTVPDNIKAYEGIYGAFSGSFKISINYNGQLTLSTLDTNPTKQVFVYSGDGKFYSYDGSAYLTFVEDKGNTYLYASAYSSLPLIGQTVMSLYQGQRLDPKPLSKELNKAWKPYLNKDYFLVSEKFSSIVYSQKLPSQTLEVSKDLPNYIGVAEIVDKTTAKPSLEIPGMFGRDLSDIKVYTKDNVQYIKAGASVYVSGDSITNLPTKKSFTVTTPKSSYAKYYKIGSKAAGKMISVSLPKDASFTVYDSKGAMNFSSLISGKKTTKLPKGGYIVFVGSNNTKIKVSCK